MSSSSDSEDENLKQILEAADTNFLSESLYKAHQSSNEKTEVTKSRSEELPPSQRHLNHDDTSDIDFTPSETVQKIMAKKLSSLVQEQVEFVIASELTAKQKKNRKSRVRLFNECDCYVKPFEEFEYDDPGPRTKPQIKRRDVDNDAMSEVSKLQKAAIDGEFVLSLKETNAWTERKRSKLFHYKQGKGIHKDHHLIEPPNEFTKVRQKNQWNELKIRNSKFSVPKK